MLAMSTLSNLRFPLATDDMRYVSTTGSLLLALLLATSGCDNPATTTSGGEPNASSESPPSKEAESQEPDEEMASVDYPGVEAIPADVHDRIQEALARKKKKDDPTYRTHHKTDEGLPKYTNRLILSSSPYLRQHAHNPVNWFSWGEAAFEKAREENKPILLSVGYATCHWCHVMERKSFEDLEIAEYLNEHYVAIKVDREENPHIDDTYMNAVRMLSGGGGWPMTVWLTPQKLPFMGGTYFPPDRFMSLLKEMKNKYEENPNNIRQRAQELASKINRRMSGGRAESFPDAETAMTRTFDHLDRTFDDARGGWRGGNKFPAPSKIRFLLRYHKRTDDERALEIVTETLDAMANGGIYDYVGGGFFRYSVDPEWMVPHFEKMLYTNAQLALVYTEAWQVTGDPEYARVVRETLDYLMKEMTSEEGALYAAESADSFPEPGAHKREEGAFYVWTTEEIEKALSKKNAKLVQAYYGVTDSGNFEGGHTVLHTDRSRQEVAESLGIDLETFERRLERARKKLYHVRDQRPHPPLDDHLLAAWNGMGLEAFARAALVFDDDEWRSQARSIASFILEDLRRDDGTLMRRRTQGEGFEKAYSSDYAFSIAGLLSLYEASGELRWLKGARNLQDLHLTHYWDDDKGGFYQTPVDSEVLIGRKKSSYDGSTPSSNAYSALNLLRLYQLTLDEQYQTRAEELFEFFGGEIERRGVALTQMLVALDFLDAKPREIAFVKPGDEASNPLMNTYRNAFLPNAVLVRTTASEVPTLAEMVEWMQKKEAKKGKTTAYVCRDFTCKYPTTEPDTFENQISEVVPLSGDSK
jgi:uncharacterized protein YyaL (SSP411 family)